MAIEIPQKENRMPNFQAQLDEKVIGFISVETTGYDRYNWTCGAYIDKIGIDNKKMAQEAKFIMENNYYFDLHYGFFVQDNPRCYYQLSWCEGDIIHIWFTKDSNGNERIAPECEIPTKAPQLLIDTVKKMYKALNS